MLEASWLGFGFQMSLHRSPCGALINSVSAAGENEGQDFHTVAGHLMGGGGPAKDQQMQGRGVQRGH